VKRGILVVAACAAAVALAGCSESATGLPQPTPGTPGTNQTSSSATPPKSATTTAPTGSKQEPCSLLSSTEATGLGLGEGKVKNAAGLKFCDWKSTASSDAISVGYGENSLDSLNGQSVSIGKHKAAQLPPHPIFGTCPIAIGLPDSTTVIVLGTGTGGNDAGVCPKVLEVAKIIDPKLP
jgi:hypothetical protein